MLQRAAAAMAEMRARRSGASVARVQQFDDPAFASSAADGTDPGTHTIARHRERQEDRRAVIFGDAFAAPPSRSTASSTTASAPLGFPQRDRVIILPPCSFFEVLASTQVSLWPPRCREQYGASFLQMGSARRRGAAGSGRGPGDRRCPVLFDSGRCRCGKGRFCYSLFARRPCGGAGCRCCGRSYLGRTPQLFRGGI